MAFSLELRNIFILKYASEDLNRALHYAKQGFVYIDGELKL